MSSARQTFHRSRRIRQRREFVELYERGSRRRGRFMTVFVRFTAGPASRLGVAASKRFGPAVARNRAKRRARELFRLASLPRACDVVIVPRREILAAAFSSLQEDFARLVLEGPRRR